MDGHAPASLPSSQVQDLELPSPNVAAGWGQCSRLTGPSFWAVFLKHIAKSSAVDTTTFLYLNSSHIFSLSKLRLSSQLGPDLSASVFVSALPSFTKNLANSG